MPRDHVLSTYYWRDFKQQFYLFFVLTCVRNLANEGTSGDRFSVELDVDGVGLGLLGREVNEATPSTQNLKLKFD